MKKHYVAGFVGLSLLFSLITPVFAEEIASSTPEIIPEPEPIVEVLATSTEPVASSTEPVASSTEPVASSTVLFLSLASDIASSTEEVASSTEQVASSTQIFLRIETFDTTLFNQSIDVLPCQPNLTSATTTNGYCAVQQAGLTSDWTFGAFGGMLNSLGGYVGDWTKYWLWFQDSNSGMTSLDTHVLTSGEHLLLTFGENGLNPLRLTAGTTTLDQYATTTFSVSSPGFDETWSPVFLPIASTTFSINGSSFDVASSSLEWSTSTPGTYTFLVKKNGYVSSEPLIITVNGTQSTSTASTTGQTGNPNPSGGSSNPNPQSTNFNVDAAIAFLISKQNVDGSFCNQLKELCTDWAAIALSSYTGASEAKAQLKNYFLLSSFSGNLTTDYERHAMALMSLGINPYSGAVAKNYIQPILENIDAQGNWKQTGYNDDIFALFPLLKAGYTSSDQIIQTIVQSILAKQGSSGSFRDVDTTSAAIQALSQVTSIGGVSDAISKAENYLRSPGVQSNGGFGSSFTTSWALQGIYALGSSPSSWTQNNENPLTYLATLQQTDGGIDLISTGADNRIWATSYAIPAALGKPWPTILASFPKPDQSSPNANTNNTQTATSTQPIATTTTPVATSTAPIDEIRLSLIPSQVLAETQNTETIQELVISEISDSSTTTEDVPISNQNLAAVGEAIPSSRSNTLLISGFVLVALGLGYSVYRFRNRIANFRG